MPERFQDPYHLSCLQEMGLTHLEALVYSALLLLGPSHAKRVSEATHLAREHTYEVLRKLQAKGLVELVLSRSSWYVAVEPRVAVNGFITKIESHSTELKEKAYEVGAWLQKLRNSSNQTEEDTMRFEPQVRVVFGGAVFHEFERNLKAAKSEYRGVVASSTLKTQAGLNTLQLLEAAARRNLRVRLITETKALEDDSVMKLSKAIGIRTHHSAGLGARYSIFDGGTVMLALHEPVPSKEEIRVVSSDNPTFARGFVLHFNQLWDMSKPPHVVQASRSR